MAWDGELTPTRRAARSTACWCASSPRRSSARRPDALEGIDGADVLAELSSGRAFAGRSTATLLDLLERRDDAFFRDERTWSGVHRATRWSAPPPSSASGSGPTRDAGAGATCTASCSTTRSAACRA